jgi:hypothetical protein
MERQQIGVPSTDSLTPECGISKSLAEEKIQCRSQPHLRHGLGHIDQLTVATPRAVYCHNSDVK